MSLPDHQNDIIREALARGYDVSALSDQQYEACAIAIRSRRELVEDSLALVGSRIRTSIGLKVLPQKIEANFSQCQSNACGKFRNLASGEPACDWCNCSGNNLRSKLADPYELCPAGYWSNFT